MATVPCKCLFIRTCPAYMLHVFFHAWLDFLHVFSTHGWIFYTCFGSSFGSSFGGSFGSSFGSTIFGASHGPGVGVTPHAGKPPTHKPSTPHRTSRGGVGGRAGLWRECLWAVGASVCLWLCGRRCRRVGAAPASPRAREFS